MLRCPACLSRLKIGSEIVCEGAAAHRFPIVNGIPVVIDDSKSLFRVADFVQQRDTFFPPQSRFVALVKRFMPTITLNLSATRNYRRLRGLLQEKASPRILVLGGSILGDGISELLAGGFETVDSDVSIGPRTGIVCDAHQIPFADATFDCVVAQAILEHVVDPERCVSEIFRVLKNDGHVYAETPFMQQVHGGRYDFTRFTFLGHRRLFRRFRQIDAGAAGGPGMALAWAYRYFLMSFVRGSALKNAVKLFAHATSFFLKYVDPWIADRPSGLDAASGYYFLGTRSETTLSDRELIELYPGAPRGEQRQ
jgi:SAM-dependent methyltransferase